MAGSNVAGSPPEPRLSVDAGRLWGGGLATACVAALLAVAGVLICQDVLDIRLVRPALLLDLAHSFTVDYAVTAFVLALVATGLAHALLLTTPRPRTFFAWIIGLATLCGVAAPFAFDTARSSQVATAAINLALGICIGSLIGAVMSRTVSVASRSA